MPAEAASSYLFPLRMGWQQAARVLLTGDWVSGPEAVDLGMALQVCADDRVVEETVALARRVAALPPDAVQAIKRLMWAAQADEIVAARAREDDALPTRPGGHGRRRERRLGGTGGRGGGPRVRLTGCASGSPPS